MKVHLLLVVFNVMFHVASAVRKEPMCSGLTFEQELLQKMARLEFELEQMKKEMNNKIFPAVDRLQQPQVAFIASHPSTLVPEYKQIIVFQKVTLNEGSAYNPQTGIFVAPVNGLYHFTAHVCNDFTKAVVVALIHNGNVQALSTQYESSYGGCGSVSALVRINVGDIVNVVNYYNSSYLREDVFRGNSFIGFRLI